MGYSTVVGITLLVLDYSADNSGTMVCLTFPDLLIVSPPLSFPSLRVIGEFDLDKLLNLG